MACYFAFIFFGRVFLSFWSCTCACFFLSFCSHTYALYFFGVGGACTWTVYPSPFTRVQDLPLKIRAFHVCAFFRSSLCKFVRINLCGLQSWWLWGNLLFVNFFCNKSTSSMAFCRQCTNTLFLPSQAQLTRQQQQFEATMKEREERWKQQRQQEGMQFQTTKAQSKCKNLIPSSLWTFLSDKPEQLWLTWK